ncbi:MAG TPA: prolipoprotein diacylglyceryl transferase [Candidatus Ratteibacteria bacterium]|jgi:phosphatidylglycerol:prolipoprotein diacylglycerol transferase|uniref:Phosphatidylglycerol--prolipoprotein diacylglyceryl transferase n=1 Tax=candidate division TA06 bacterium ADurb.Bin131 TaxID=1852827 RepID=A0A1V6C695_UNCT6|nr:MAG: Prolipoprotein diacylglyceryl transferase [candidate division TA06 bacterium ADurb.Bin131]HOC02571.1 prolipoprotein diacylglyceryl transferase [bacterium]HRS06501.1 prolipoprotein diacylglyceryl transferase [Candidatus Ratteibacteria bacterium]HON06149.1 prolipoprotein diacylglyceryl transferase [bacterium]HPC29395.1 prolipoprotein diacylglyceryl transferase [bacterium]
MHPECFRIGNFVIYWYGIFVALGVVISCLLFQNSAKKNNIPEDVSGRIILYTIIFGIIGARVIHVFSYYHYYFRNPIEIIMIRNGGLAIQGGILFGILGLVYGARRTKVDVLQTLDLAAAVVPLGQAIGRIGCLLHGCCYGRSSDRWYSLKFPFLDTRVEPTQIYYFIGDLIIFLFLYLFSKDKHKNGEITAWYFIFFGSFRYWIDQFRGDLIPNAYGFYPTQVYGIICFLIGAFWIFRIFFFRQKTI